MKNEKFTLYKEHPKTCAPNDFWGQVKRTVNGKPVSEDQIQLIVNAALSGLNLSKDDCLLDLCCGNGALTDRLIPYCHSSIGVDFSEYLIKIANEYFASPPLNQYILDDVVTFCSNHTNDKFTKVMCYGSFSYLENESAADVLVGIRDNFVNVRRIFIGNYPDRDKLFHFFTDNNYIDGIEFEADSPLGIWRTKSEFSSLAEQNGWKATFSNMPSEYYAAHYRYDVVLSRL